eukprot:jgi/Ulvmu1/12747/UM095_0052.1
MRCAECDATYCRNGRRTKILKPESAYSNPVSSHTAIVLLLSTSAPPGIGVVGWATAAHDACWRNVRAAEVSLAICNTGSLPFTKSAEDIATATATAAATAIATAQAACTSSGQASFKVNGVCIAQATATAWASAFASAVATSSVCGKCSTTARVTGEAIAEEIVTATATIALKLDSVNGPTAVANLIVADIQTITVVAIAQVQPWDLNAVWENVLAVLSWAECLLPHPPCGIFAIRPCITVLTTVMSVRSCFW